MGRRESFVPGAQKRVRPERAQTYPVNCLVAERRRLPGPRDIDLSTELRGAFGKAEVEREAVRLILFLRFAGAWNSFSLRELRRFYRTKLKVLTDPPLRGLLGAWFDSNERSMRLYAPKPFIVMDISDGDLYVTNHFVNRLRPYWKKR
jgi:hypothetical protein